MYLDANSLYGWGMSENLPVDSFKWVKVCQYLMKIYKKI